LIGLQRNCGIFQGTGDGITAGAMKVFLMIAKTKLTDVKVTYVGCDQTNNYDPFDSPLI